MSKFSRTYDEKKMIERLNKIYRPWTKSLGVQQNY